MFKRHVYDAIVVGAGPNGLSAAITLAREGLSVLVLEANDTVGGGARSKELTLPGFVNDICSAVHPLAVGSPFFRTLPLADYGLEFIQPPASLVHPFDDGTAAVLFRSVEKTSRTLEPDGENYRRLFESFVERWNDLATDILAPPHVPHHPFTLARFGLKALRSARALAGVFKSEHARAFFAGLAAHSSLPLEAAASASFGLVLGITGHTVGWAFPHGGAQKIPDSLSAYLLSLGSEIKTGVRVENIDELPTSKVILCDITPRQLLSIAGHRLSNSYKRQLERFKYGAAAFKIDWALSEPIPWKARECKLTATVHLGGTLNEIAVSENAAWHNTHAEKPFVLLTQPSLFDSSRAPKDKHTAWAYCHVPNNSNFDMTERIEAQIERFAPGFRDCILARSVMSPMVLEHHNANLIGGDINGGANTLRQILARPLLRFNPYSTSVKGLYLCSSSTPPGGGVHGMCGYHSAKAALRNFS